MILAVNPCGQSVVNVALPNCKGKNKVVSASKVSFKLMRKNMLNRSHSRYNMLASYHKAVQSHKTKLTQFI